MNVPSNNNLVIAIKFTLDKMGIESLQLPNECAFHVNNPVSFRRSIGMQVQIHIYQHDYHDLQGVIVYTNDCLRDYLHYKVRKVEFTSRPQYGSRGLFVDFYESSGRIFTYWKNVGQPNDFRRDST